MPNYAIGIDLGGTKILTGLVNKGNGEVLYSIKQKTGKEKDAETIVEKLKLSKRAFRNFSFRYCTDRFYWNRCTWSGGQR